MTGPVAFVGGGEFLAHSDLDDSLLSMSGGSTVTVIPTAAASQRPEEAIKTARRYFRGIGAQVEPAMVLTRRDAEDEALANQVRSCGFIYLTGGDPRYLVEVLRDSAVWEAIREANHGGAVVAGSSAGAMAFCDRMVVPGADGAVAGLGCFEDLLVLPHFSSWGKRIRQIATATTPTTRILGIDESTGLVFDGDRCHILGRGRVVFYRGGDKVWSHPAPMLVESIL